MTNLKRKKKLEKLKITKSHGHIYKTQQIMGYKPIIELIKPGSKVIDLGCGSGELLNLIRKEKQAKVTGIEIMADKVKQCIARGIFATHGDIEEGILEDYPDKSFDYVVINQTIQALYNPKYIIKQALRIGEKVIISFPNYAHLSFRLKLLFSGMPPKINILPYEWYETPNIIFITVKAFRRFCKEFNIKIEEERYIVEKGKLKRAIINLLPNMFAHFALFVISDGK